MAPLFPVFLCNERYMARDKDKKKGDQLQWAVVSNHYSICFSFHAKLRIVSFFMSPHTCSTIVCTQADWVITKDKKCKKRQHQMRMIVSKQTKTSYWEVNCRKPNKHSMFPKPLVCKRRARWASLRLWYWHFEVLRWCPIPLVLCVRPFWNHAWQHLTTVYLDKG